jgi:hypothetical protein
MSQVSMPRATSRPWPTASMTVLAPLTHQQGVAGIDEFRAFDGDGVAPAVLAPAAETVLDEADAGQASLVVGEDLDRRAESANLHVLALGFEDFVLGDRDVFLGGAQVDGDLLGAEAPCHPRAIERGEAGAHHGDAPADRLALAPVQLHQEIEAVFGARRRQDRIVVPF